MPITFKKQNVNCIKSPSGYLYGDIKNFYSLLKFHFESHRIHGNAKKIKKTPTDLKSHKGCPEKEKVDQAGK